MPKGVRIAHMQARSPFLLILFGALTVSFCSSGCDFLYGILQKEGAQERKLLGKDLTLTPSPKVEEVQRLLRLYGHPPGRIDGKMGPRTRQAIADFQKEQGLPKTRFVDYKTWEKLNALQANGLVREGRIDIAQLQRALKNAQFSPGRIDGKLGPRTKEALRAFQKANGLLPDAKIGVKTLLKLNEYMETP